MGSGAERRRSRDQQPRAGSCRPAGPNGPGEVRPSSVDKSGCAARARTGRARSPPRRRTSQAGREHELAQGPMFQGAARGSRVPAQTSKVSSTTEPMASRLEWGSGPGRRRAARADVIRTARTAGRRSARPSARSRAPGCAPAEGRARPRRSWTSAPPRAGAEQREQLRDVGAVAVREQHVEQHQVRLELACRSTASAAVPASAMTSYPPLCSSRRAIRRKPGWSSTRSTVRATTDGGTGRSGRGEGSASESMVSGMSGRRLRRHRGRTTSNDGRTP